MHLTFEAKVTFTTRPTITFEVTKTDMNLVIVNKTVHIPTRFIKDFVGKEGTYTGSEFTRLIKAIDPKLLLMEEITPFTVKADRFKLRTSPVRLWFDGKEIYLFTGNVFKIYHTELNTMMVCTRNYMHGETRSFACEKELLGPAMCYILNGFSNKAARYHKIKRETVIERAENILTPKPEKTVLQNKVIQEEKKRKAFFNRPMSRTSVAVAY